MYEIYYPSNSFIKQHQTPQFSVYQNEDCINNIVEPTEELGGIYIGNIDAAQSYEMLKQYNIRSVLTVASQTGIKYNQQIIQLHEVILAEDTPYYNLHQHFNRIINFIQKARQIGSVLVHCYAGISRSSSAVIAYLMKLNKWTYEKAYYYCKTKRRWINPNPGFVKQLLQFENELQQEDNQDKVKQLRSTSSQDRYVQKQQQLYGISQTHYHQPMFNLYAMESQNYNNQYQKQNFIFGGQSYIQIQNNYPGQYFFHSINQDMTTSNFNRNYTYY